jgi:signal transduction histidine kinase
MLDSTRLEHGQLSIERAAVDLAALARQVVAEIQPTLDTGRHTIRLLAETQPLMVLGDMLRLEQVLQNLIGNAVKYSPGGGEIVVRLAQQDAQAHIEVHDTGIGIPAGALPQLFQRFYRAGNAGTQQISGMGIGLYVVREIVTLHGGTVAVESCEGAGSIFTVQLPLLASARAR